MDKNFGGLIWTNHALDRLRQRGIKQGDAWVTWKNPDQSRYAKSHGTWIYHKNINGQQVEVVAKQNDRPAQAGKKEWLILSVWSKEKWSEKSFNKKKKPSILKSLMKSIFGR